MGKRDRLWKKLWVLALCGVMAMEPAAVYAEETAEAMNAADAQADVSMELPEDAGLSEEMEEGTAPELDEMSEEFSSDGTTETNAEEVPEKEKKEISAGEVTEADAKESDTGETVASYDDYGLEVESVTEVEQSPLAAQASNELSGTCGTNVTWSLKDGVLTVSGNGAMDDFIILVGDIDSESNPCPWEDYKAQIREVYIEDGVTSIGSIAFSNCDNLKKVVVGNSVKTIGSDAFLNDEKLTELVLGNSVETIRSRAFGDIGVTTISFPASLKNIEDHGLLGLQNVEKFEVAAGGAYQSIDGILYTDNGRTFVACPCRRSGEYQIPSNVTKIKTGAFTYTQLSRIVIPDSVTEIEEDTFDHSDTLKTIVFGKGAEVIPDACCFFDRALSSVTIPEGVTTIEKNAFQCCDSLEAVILPSTIKNVDEAFDAHVRLTIKNENLKQIENGSLVDGFDVKLTATEMYKNAFAVLDLVNAERRKAGVPELVMDQGLLETAMQRSFETALYFNHTRVNGASCFTANSEMMGENIARWAVDPEGVMSMWMDSDGHRWNILSARYKSMGVGCVCLDGGYYYWVQCFGTEVGTTVTANAYRDTVNTRNILVKKEKPCYTAQLYIPYGRIEAGDTGEFSVLWEGHVTSNTNAVVVSSDPSVCEVRNGMLVAKKAGTVTITMYYGGYKEAADTRTITVTGKTSASKPSTSQPQSKNTYKVSFYPNGGQGGMIVQSVKKKAKLKTLPKVVRSGYQFSGWYTAKTKGKKVSASTKVTKNLKLYARWTKVKVAKPSIKKAVNKKKQKAAITVSKVSGAKGYQLLYADNAKFKNAKTITISKPSTTLKNLQKGKTYYVKARAYKKDSTGKKVFGAYGKSKKVKIRK